MSGDRVKPAPAEVVALLEDAVDEWLRTYPAEALELGDGATSDNPFVVWAEQASHRVIAREKAPR